MNEGLNQITEQVIGEAIEVHRELGPGLLESAYQRALAHELRLREIAFEEQKLEGGKERTVLHLHPDLAPVKVAVIPLARNKPDMVELAKRIKKNLQSTGRLRSLFDDSGNIGKCYARQDEIGTPFCVTVDHLSLEDRQVTVRHRDTMLQDRISVDSLERYLEERLKN